MLKILIISKTLDLCGFAGIKDIKYIVYSLIDAKDLQVTMMKGIEAKMQDFKQ